MRSTPTAIATVCLLIAGSLNSTIVAGSAVACASSDELRPRGLVVVVPSEQQLNRAALLQALTNPSISGVALQINWRELEPVAGQPVWSRLDELFAAAESSHKWVHLLVFPGFFSPAWALEGADVEVFAIQYGPGRGTPTKLPMPWDSVYLGRWLDFMQQLSERYGGAPAFRLMAASGPTSVSAEMTLPVKPKDLESWLRHGYTPQKYQAAWEQVFRTFAQLFRNQCISVSAPNIPILEHGRVRDPEGHAQARQVMIDSGRRAFGDRFVLQWSDLHMGQARVEAPDQTSLVISYSGRFITGLQMRTAAVHDSAVMGAPGDPPMALRRSIDKGMQRNGAGRHVDYLEIYEPDVLASEMQPVLQYGASLFTAQ